MIVNKNHRQDLLKIAKKLQGFSRSCPTDENGEPTETYLEYLSLMYNPEIAKIVQHLELFPKLINIVKFSKKVDIDKKILIEKLDEVAKRGFIVNFGRQYSLPVPYMVCDNPFVYEKNYKSENAKNFAELGTKFFSEEEYYKKFQTTQEGTPRFRILTVSEEIEPGHEIIPAEEVYSIIEQNHNFTLIPCPCRNRAEIKGERKCKDKYPIHTCLLLGPYATAVLEIEDGVMKSITKEEAKKITKKASELGLVHTTDNVAKECTVICACCECCCEILSGLTIFDNPRAVGKANYIAHVDENICVGCGTCIERCKFSAITIKGVSKRNVDKCMGCGLCAVTCPNKAITMKRFEREEIPLEWEIIEKL